MTIAELPVAVSVAVDTRELVSRLRAALQATMFGSRRLITPRRIGQIAEQTATSFVNYANGVQDEAAIRSFGHRLAEDGLGHTTALAMVNALHEIIWQCNQSETIELPISVRYSSALLEGYMAGWEAILLQEQERARIGYNRAQASTANSH